MDIWVVGVAMPHSQVSMRMAVLVAPIPFQVMLMLMVFVMNVFMPMLHFLMQMFMCMVLGQMKPDTKTHQRRSNPKRHVRFFCKNQQGDRSTDKRRS